MLTTSYMLFPAACYPDFVRPEFLPPPHPPRPLQTPPSSPLLCIGEPARKLPSLAFISDSVALVCIQSVRYPVSGRRSLQVSGFNLTFCCWAAHQPISSSSPALDRLLIIKHTTQVQP